MRTWKVARGAQTTRRLGLLMVAAIVLLNCQSEEERIRDEQREELRNAIVEIEQAQKRHIEAQRELVALYEKHEPKRKHRFIMTTAERERAKLEGIEKLYAADWQSVIGEQIEQAEGMELRVIGMELTNMGEKATFGLTSVKRAMASLERRMSTPKEQRMP